VFRSLNVDCSEIHYFSQTLPGKYLLPRQGRRCDPVLIHQRRITMCNTSIKQTAESFFGNAISTYTRAQAIEDGVLIDPGTMAKEAGFNKWPVALTANAWADCVAWTDDDSEQQVHQDQSGRLCYKTHDVSLS
jgi:hypothetical protein